MGNLTPTVYTKEFSPVQSIATSNYGILGPVISLVCRLSNSVGDAAVSILAISLVGGLLGLDFVFESETPLRSPRSYQLEEPLAIVHVSP